AAINGAPVAFDQVDQCIDRRSVADIQRGGPDIVARQVRRLKVGRHDPRAFFAQQVHDRAANPPARARDEGDAPGKPAVAAHACTSRWAVRRSDSRGAIMALASGPVSWGCRKGTDTVSSEAA